MTAAPAPDDLLQLDRQLCFALYSTSLAMTKLYQPLLAPLSLTYPQYLVLLALWEQDGPSVSQLGARVQLDSGTLSPLLKRLEGAGLITRQRAAQDERRVHVNLTHAGRALKDRARHVPACAFQASGCSLAELDQLTADLRALRARLTRAEPLSHQPKEKTP
jgi:DNA-binding MarR family transcriptional regulator